MGMLVPCPLVDQLNESTADGGPDEAMYANCVPASLSSALQALTGKTYDGDQLRDAVYGEGSTGATDPAAYRPYLAAQGVTMWEVTGDQELLITVILDALLDGRPATGAIPSMWATAPADPVHPVGSTHEVVWCDYDGVNLTAMNPWPSDGQPGAAGQAFYQTQPVAWWQARIVYGRVFPMEGNMGVPIGWSDDGTTLKSPAGVPVHGAIRSWVLAHNWHPLLFPVASEGPVPTYTGLVEQWFADGHGRIQCVRWTQAAGCWMFDDPTPIISEQQQHLANAAAGGQAAAQLATLKSALQAALAAAA